MQVVLLAAGESSRFWPLCEGKHKSLIKIMGKPLIQYTVENLKSMGLNDIIIVQDPKRQVERELKDLKGFKFVVQEEPKGMAHALLCAKDLIKDKFILLSPYHFEVERIVPNLLSLHKKTNAPVALLGKETSTPWLYGILDVQDGVAKGIIEKPKPGEEPSNIKVISTYLLSK